MTTPTSDKFGCKFEWNENFFDPPPSRKLSLQNSDSYTGSIHSSVESKDPKKQSSVDNLKNLGKKV